MNFLKDIMKPEVRQWLYGVVAAILPILLLLGYITEEMLPLISAAVLAVLGFAVAGSNIDKDKISDKAALKEISELTAIAARQEAAKRILDKLEESEQLKEGRLYEITKDFIRLETESDDPTHSIIRIDGGHLVPMDLPKEHSAELLANELSNTGSVPTVSKGRHAATPNSETN